MSKSGHLWQDQFVDEGAMSVLSLYTQCTANALKEGLAGRKDHSYCSWVSSFWNDRPAQVDVGWVICVERKKPVSFTMFKLELNHDSPPQTVILLVQEN
jgi:hypothetical protein